MNNNLLQTYLDTIDPHFQPTARALHRVVIDTCPDLQVKISYKMLMYGFKGDYRHWICAIGASSKRVSLRFLFGALLDDTQRLFRAGTSPTLRTLDFDSTAEVDPDLIAGFVRQAVDRLDQFRQQSAAE